MIEVAVTQIVILTLVSITLGLVIGLAINKL
jgi:predicted lysophospholipase L1 biosynthesis ABC-type transport system permease subunit